MWKAIRENPRAVLYAVIMHIMLLLLLVFSLDWTPKISRPAGQKVPIEATLVDQRQLDAVAERKRAEERKVEEAKRQQALEEKRKVEAEQKRKVEAEQKRKVEAEQKRKSEQAAKQKAEADRKRKAEVAAKQKAEAKRKAEQAAKQKAEAERKRKAEQAAKQKAEADRKRKAEEAERARAEAEMRAQLAAEQSRLEEQRVQSVLGEYIAYIADKVERNWLRPPGSPAGMKCTVNVKLIPGGDVVSARVVQSSGDSMFDDSAEKAVLRAAPLPVPDDPSISKHFRDFNFIFKPL